MLRALLVALTLGAAAVGAQDLQPEGLSPIDRQYMQQQRDHLDGLARRHLGEPLRGERSDLAVLQRLLDRGLVAREDTATLQGMGMVLGNLLAADLDLEWVVHRDRQGRSRALRIPGTGELLFPVTMISRRHEVGARVDVDELYQRAADLVAEIRHRDSPF